MCKKFISLLLSLTILLGAVWVPAGASADPPTPQTVKLTLMPNITGVLGVTSIHNLNESYTLPTSANHPFQKDVPIGKEFVGWGESPTPSSVLSGSYTLTGDTTLYAIWRDIKYTVTFDLNGPSGTNPTSTVTYNGTYTLPATPEYDSKHIFDGWYTAPTGGTRITASTRVTTASDHTLYAHWTEKCTVTFDSDGGTSVQPKTYNKGAAYGSLPSPSKTGFTFDGWYESVSSTTKVQSSDIVDSDKNLIAKWSPRKYTVTLNLDCSDTVTGFDKTSFQIGKDETYAAAGSTELGQTPTRTGYNFMGWYTDRNGQGDKIESNTSKQYGKTTDQILYAHWEANKYTLTFKYAFPTPNAAWKNPDGSAQTTAPTDPSDMTNGATYNSPYPTLPTPAPNDIPYYAADSTEKYTFEGWYDLKEDVVNTSDPTKNKTGNKVTGGTNGSTYQTDGDQTLYARWGYDIEFFANNTDDVNTETAFATLKCVTGAPYGSLPTGRPSKPGYEFLGWYKGAEDNADKFEPTASDIADGSVKKVYAHWGAAKYTVSFDANGGEAVTTTVTATFKDKYPTLPNPANRTGYEFAGWFTDKEGGTKVTAGVTEVTATDKHTLYAHWTPKSYSVSLDYKLPSGIAYNKPSEKLDPIKIGEKLRGLPSEREVPSFEYGTDDKNNTQFTFVGWYTSTGKYVNSVSDLSPEMLDANQKVTLHARWKYNIKCYHNKTASTSSDPGPFDLKECTTETVYGELPTPVNTGKTLVGWFTDPVSGRQIVKTDTADYTTVLELYARWSTSEYVITLDPNGGKFKEELDTKAWPYTYGDKYGGNVNDSRFIPELTGHSFTGWFTEKEGGVKIRSTDTVTATRTIYARWEANQFKVTLNLNYGSSSSVKTVDYGTELSKVLTEPERTGYAFEGWFTDQKCENPVAPDTKVTSDVTLYAKWIEAKRVNLVVNGGTLPSGTPAYINVYENGQYNLPTPTWTGCTFQGWYTQENGGTKVSYGDKVPAVDSIPSTLYAQWIPMDVTVTFDPNGSPNHQASTRTYKVGSKYGIGLGALNWSGYKFMGWYTQPTGGEKIEATTVVTVKSSNDLTITLYAHWGYEVSFDPTDGSGSMDPQVAEINQPYTLPVCTFEPPAGMRFGGWAAGTPEASTTYPGGSQYTVNRRVTFYATWTTAPIVITATCTSGGRLTTEDGKTNEVTVERGTDITFVAQANDGYELKELLVDGVNYNYTDVHTFRDVMEDHTIHAVFQRIGAPSYSTCDHGTSCPLNSYSDLNTSEWYHDAIHYCVDNVVMGGTGSSKFYPRRNTTRAELAVSLYNHEGRPPVAGSGLLPNTYSDVKAGEWHYQAIEWATKEGILAGYGNGKFRPNQSVTREQLVAIIWRHAGSPKPRSTTLRFYDAGSVSGYAWEAMCWATEQGILQGRSSGYLVPKGTATRAEVAQMLKNYLN